MVLAAVGPGVSEAASHLSVERAGGRFGSSDAMNLAPAVQTPAAAQMPHALNGRTAVRTNSVMFRPGYMADDASLTSMMHGGGASGCARSIGTSRSRQSAAARETEDAASD